MADKTRTNARKPNGPTRPSGGGARRTPTSPAAQARAATAARGGPARPVGAQATSARQQQKALRSIQGRSGRNKAWLQIGIPVLVVIAVVGILVGVKLSSGPKNATGQSATLASAATLAALGKVDTSVYNQIGAGSGSKPPIKVAGSPLTGDGKPRVLYMGAEYCPYCAAERWATVAALQRFGTFTNLGQTASSPNDTNPSTQTLSFHGASYTSQYLSFTGVEMQSNDIVNGQYATLDKPSAADQALLTKYDNPPYQPANGAGGIPFIDFGNSYIVGGASYDGSILQGLSHEQIAQDMSDPSTNVAKAIDGTANIQTAAICQLTNNQPANVCTSAGVQAGKAKLPTSTTGPAT